ARRAQYRRRRDGRRRHDASRGSARRARRRHRRGGRRGGEGRAAASRGRAAGRCTPRRGDREEPGVQRRRPRARLVGGGAFPEVVVPRPVRDSEPEDHGSRSRRRRPLSDRAAENLSTLLTNARVVTMDDAGAEYEGGWILIEDGLVKDAGAGTRPDADDVHNLDAAVVTPGLVNAHHHLWQNLTRARAQDENLFAWLKALYPVWAALDEEAEY